MTDGSHRASVAPALSNRSYDILKQIVTVYLPGLATLYLGLDLLWDLPYEVQISGTVTAVATFLGLALKKSSTTYADQPVEYDGELLAVKLGDNPTDLLLSLDSQEQAEQIREKGEVTFKVVVR